MKKFRKLLAILVALSMCLSLLGTVAFAAEDEPPADGTAGEETIEKDDVSAPEDTSGPEDEEQGTVGSTPDIDSVFGIDESTVTEPDEEAGDKDPAGNDEQQPGNNDQQPGDDEQQPAGGEQQPAGDEQQPAGGDDQQPAGDEQQPGDDEQQPAGGEQQPAGGDQQLGDDAQQPGDGDQQPAGDDQQPLDGQLPEEEEKCGHANTKLQNAKAATCTEDGYSGDIFCKDCETVVKPGEVIDPLGHDFDGGLCARCDDVDWDWIGEQTISAKAKDGAVVTVSGVLPVLASVTAVPVKITLEDLEVLAAYDITIWDGKCNEIQPGETVKVSIVTPALADVDEVEVYHIADTTAEAELVDTVSIGEKAAEFEAKSFSYYVLAAPWAWNDPDKYAEGAEFELQSLEALKAFASAVNGGKDFKGMKVTLNFEDKTVKLSGEWTPIGFNGTTKAGPSYTGTAFRGEFDGKGHTIKGLEITTKTATNKDNVIGFFGVLDGGTVKNLTFEDVTISVRNAKCKGVGAAVGGVLNGGTVSGITVTGTVTAFQGGGVVGHIYADGTVKDCVNEATIDCSDSGAGGIVAKAYYTLEGKEMTISNCTNKGTVIATNGYTGGIVGLSAANITKCVNEADVTSETGGGGTGGIVGYASNYGTISECENKGTISGGGACYGVGGIVGWINYQKLSDYPLTAPVIVTKCVNRGSVESDKGAGGIVGIVYNAATITLNENYAPFIRAGSTDVGDEKSGFAGGIAGGLQNIAPKEGESVPLYYDSFKVAVTNNVSSTPINQILGKYSGLFVYDNTEGKFTVERNRVPVEDPVAKIGTMGFETLAEALSAAQNGETVVLLKDVTGNVTIPADKTVTLNLNGKTLTNDAPTHTIKNEGTLTVNAVGGGKVVNTGSGATLANYPGSAATINGGAFEKSGSWYSIKNLGALTINGGDFTIDNANSSMIDNGWYGNTGNDLGLTGTSEASLTITGGTFRGGMNSVKNDDYGTATITGGTFSNTSGAVLLNWNEMAISGGSFTCGASGKSVIAVGYLNDTADKGDLRISGGTFTAQGSCGALFGYPGGTKQGGKVMISGGSFTGGINVNTKTHYGMEIKGGTFRDAGNVADYVAEGFYSLSDNGTWKVLTPQALKAGNYVTVKGIAGLDKKAFLTANDAYAAGKAVLAAAPCDNPLRDGALTHDQFAQLFTEGGKITWTIYGAQTFDGAGRDRFLSFGRAAAHYNDNDHITEIHIKGATGKETDTLTFASELNFPYEWWDSAKCPEMKIYISGLKLKSTCKDNEIKIGEAYNWGYTMDLRNCYVNAAVYFYNNHKNTVTMEDNVFDGTDVSKAFAVHIQGHASLPTTINFNRNEVSGYARGVNFDQATAVIIASGNTITPGAGYSAFQLSQFRTATITGNTVHLNTNSNLFTFHESIVEKADSQAVTGRTCVATGNTIDLVEGAEKGALVYDDITAAGKYENKAYFELTWSRNTMTGAIDTTKGYKGSAEKPLSNYIYSVLNPSTTSGGTTTPTTPTTPSSRPDRGPSTSAPTVNIEDNETPLGSTPVVDVAVKTETKADGSAAAKVESSAVESAVKDAADKGGDIQITISAPESATAVSAELTAASAGKLAASTAESVTVSTPLADVSISTEAMKELSDQSKTAVTVAVKQDAKAETVTVSIQADSKEVKELSGSVKAALPVTEAQATAGTVAVIVNADGTETIVKKSMVVDGVMNVELNGSATLKLVDNSKSFNDTGAINAEFQSAVAFVSSRELFNGTTKETFSPNTAMTRQMLTTVLARLDGVDTSGGKTAHEKGTAWAVEKGISNGQNGAQALSRQQLATMLYRYAGEPFVAGGSLDAFADAANVSDYAVMAMQWCVQNGILNGSGGKLNPANPATRAQVAAMLMRFNKAMI